MDWSDYDHYHPIVRGRPGEFGRADAIREYDHLMGSRRSRIAELTDLLARNGILLNDQDDSIAEVNRWFVANVTPYVENPNRPDPMWYAVIKDLSLFLGELIIKRNPGLSWGMAVWGGSLNPSFQRHVVVGFPPEGMNIAFDTDLRLASYGVSIVRKQPFDDNQFVHWLDEAHAMAAGSGSHG